MPSCQCAATSYTGVSGGGSIHGPARAAMPTAGDRMLCGGMRVVGCASVFGACRVRVDGGRPRVPGRPAGPDPESEAARPHDAAPAHVRGAQRPPVSRGGGAAADAARVQRAPGRHMHGTHALRPPEHMRDASAAAVRGVWDRSRRLWRNAGASLPPRRGRPCCRLCCRLCCLVTVPVAETVNPSLLCACSFHGLMDSQTLDQSLA